MDELCRLSIVVAAEHEDELAAALALRAPWGWEENTLPSGETLALIHTEHAAFITELADLLRISFPEAAIKIEMVPRKDWTLAWREFFTPVEAGGLFLILAPWMEKEKREAGNRIPILIEPKTAFGTGHHASTALCLAAIADLADQGRIKSGRSFLDLGTGSGILGIACAKTGLHGLGLDIDPTAVENALENAELNQVEGSSFRIARGDLDDATGAYDLVLANILAGPLIHMAPELVKRMAPGAALVLSGILNAQADAVAAAYMRQGLPEPRRKSSAEWSALIWS